LQLKTFKTSSTKKRKLYKAKALDSSKNCEVPLESIEDQEAPQYATDLPRFDFSTSLDSQQSLPPHIPPHLQNESSLSTQDYISSAASSPSAAYAGLSIDSERGGDQSGSEGGVCTRNTESQDIRSQSPNRSFAHRAIMGGAAELPQRSSSPLKRRASDLEPEASASLTEDVEMEALPPPDDTNAIPEEENKLVEEDQVLKPAASGEMLNDTDGDKSHLADENTMSNEGNTGVPATPQKGMPPDCLRTEVGPLLMPRM
jgi:ubiquitin carboxyl-terminal hydrolase 4/11